jgi:hypothetical protein
MPSLPPGAIPVFSKFEGVAILGPNDAFQPQMHADKNRPAKAESGNDSPSPGLSRRSASEGGGEGRDEGGFSPFPLSRFPAFRFVFPRPAPQNTAAGKDDDDDEMNRHKI